MPATERELVQMIFNDDPELRTILRTEAFKAGLPLSQIIRKLLREWLIKRKVDFPTDIFDKEGAPNV